ncbi:MAG: restriction endonuclease [Clostridia bacterium]|nr:restriction endonuclease [Clostridia bacterium]
MPAINRYITSAESLVTTHEQTRAGFLSIALEKNRVGDPFVRSALAFKAMAAHTEAAEELLSVPEVRPFLITAAGLSDKSLAHLTEADQTMAIQELIDKFLKPAGSNYIDETTFRYLLIKGDAVGGTMRNNIGNMGQSRLVRAIFSSMNVMGLACDLLSTDSKRWRRVDTTAAGIEANVRALHWANGSGERLLVFNAKIPTVGKNVDISLFSGGIQDYDRGRIVRRDDRAIMFGELKAGIDPAGADEHWKTGNTALNRIRSSFAAAGYPEVKTSFIAAAIERSMAEEIYAQLEDGTLSNAANLTNASQLTAYCNWLIGE